MYLIREAEIADVYALAKNLRDGDRLEVTSLGLDPAKALRTSFRHAIIRRTAVIDGEIAAVWGLGGAMLSDIGYPWLLTAPAVERIPVSFLRVARRELGRMRCHRRCLTGHVAAQYTMACRFLEVLGFDLGPVEEIGPKKAKFRQFTLER